MVAATIADHTDYLNGATLAVDEINAAGGVKGRQIKLEHHDCDIFTPDGIQAGYRAVVDTKPDAIGSAFVPLARQTMLEALGDYKAPLLTGDTNMDLLTFAKNNRDKYWNYFQVDPPEIYYGRMFPRFLDTVAAGGVWKPTNNKVHIIREQNNYNMQIAKEVVATLPSSKFELATITDIQYPMQDWGPVMQAIKKVGAGVIMLDYWVGAEEAAFCQQFVADPVKGALVYIQYGASQPEFLNVAGSAAEGMVWSTVLGVYADRPGDGVPQEVRGEAPRRDRPLLYRVGLRHRVHPEERVVERRSRRTSRRWPTTSARIPTGASTARSTSTTNTRRRCTIRCRPRTSTRAWRSSTSRSRTASTRSSSRRCWRRASSAPSPGPD